MIVAAGGKFKRPVCAGGALLAWGQRDDAKYFHSGVIDEFRNLFPVSIATEQGEIFVCASNAVYHFLAILAVLHYRPFKC